MGKRSSGGTIVGCGDGGVFVGRRRRRGKG